MDPLQTPPLPLPVPVQDALAGLTTTEARVVGTVAVALLVALVGWVVVPRALRAVGGRLFVRDDQEATEDGLATPTPVRRLLQAGVAVAGAFALVPVWGYGEELARVAELLGVGLPLVGNAAVTVVLVVAALVAMGYLESFADSLADSDAPFDRHQSEVALRVAQVTLIGVVLVATLGVWGQNLGGLLVGAGFLGIVVGMAARQTLGSVLSGFVMMFSRPFEVGDWVTIDGEEGVVTDITIVNTRLENFDGEYVVIPNDTVSNTTIVNRTRKGRLRVRLQVGVDYTVDPERAEAVAAEALGEVEEILTVPRPQVVPTGFGDSAVLLELRFWIDKPSARRRWRSRAAVLRAVYGAFQREGIKIPFPQRELSGRQEQGGFRVREEAPGATQADPPAEPTDED